MDSHTILIVDDHQDSREALYDVLFTHYRIITATTGEESIRAAKMHRPSLILLDYEMPDIDGVEVIKNIRTCDDIRSTPIVMISGVGDESRRTKAFFTGADDFISKPVSGQELLARIMSKLSWERKLVSAKFSSVYQVGNLIFDEKKLKVTINENVLKLTHYEFLLLKYFLDHKECVLSRAQILTDVWQMDSVSTRTVDTHIYSLRQKLVEFDYELCTVHSAGYILKKKINA